MIRDIEKELGLDDVLAIEASRVSIRVDARRYGKMMTLLEGFDPAVDLKHVVKQLKQHLGTGGTAKDGMVELQGDHRAKVRAWLEKEGYPVE